MGVKSITINGKAVKQLASSGKTFWTLTHKRLPDEYQEVEWIGVSGTQSISMPVDSTLGGYYTAKIKRIATNCRNLIGSASSGATTISAGAGSYFGWNASGAWEMGGSAISSVKVSTTAFDEIRFEYLTRGTGTLTVNGTILLTRAGSSQLSNFLVFGGANYPVCAQFGEISGALSSTSAPWLLVPCYRKSDGVIGMYDITGKVFHMNEGSGHFTKGNNVYN